jgi:hypothetical protein
MRPSRDRWRIVHGLEVSMGELVEMLHRISTHAQPVLDDLKATSVRVQRFKPTKQAGEKMASRDLSGA